MTKKPKYVSHNVLHITRVLELRSWATLENVRASTTCFKEECVAVVEKVKSGFWKFIERIDVAAEGPPHQFQILLFICRLTGCK